MVFSSIPFLYYFLPVVIMGFLAAPKKLKNTVLLVASLFFYFYGEPLYILLMIFSSLSGYIHGLVIDRCRESKVSRWALISSIVVGIGLLGFFKYSNFIIRNINSLVSRDIGLLELALPIGISFYTFQVLSYTIEVYRGNARVQKDFFKFALYVSFFPQLIAGPIVRYTTIEGELGSRSYSIEDFALGVRRFIIGLSKKVLIANVLGELCDIFMKSDEKSVLFYWIYAVAFALHAYFDFSGYSDMAIGLGRIFGFHFLENFNYPFISRSLSEFWRRWHISMGSWFRDYVYIPMGGNRVSMPRRLFNLLIVWLLTGLWHGADWNFVVWGLFFAVALTLEKTLLKRLLDRLPAVFSHVYVIFLILISFTIFSANGMEEALSGISGLLGYQGVPSITRETIYYMRSYAVVLIVAIVGATPLVGTVIRKIKRSKTGAMMINALEPVFLTGLMLVITGYLVDGSFNPFLYFRF